MKKYYFFFGEGSRINQLISAIFINIPTFGYGCCIGWMSPMTLLLQSPETPRGIPLTDTEVSWIGATAYIICVPADLMFAYLGDRLGRKASLLLISAVTVAVWIFKLSSMEFWAFIAARALVGITMAGAYVIGPVYTKEISEESVRGFMGSLLLLAHTTGNLFMYVIGDYLQYKTVLWIGLAIPAVHLALFLMMPESPSFLVKKGRFEEAARVLAWLRCRNEDDPKVVQELADMRNEQDKDDESSTYVIKAILKDKVLFRAMRIVLMVSLAREVCGAVPVLNYAGEIFAKASTNTGLVLTPNQQAMMLGAVQVAGSLVGSSVVEKAGRKPLLFVTSLVSGLSMCALASWFLAQSLEVSAPAWIPVSTLCLCIFCDSSGLQPVSVVLIGEMFSYKYRGTVMAVAMALASFAAFAQMLFFKPLANAIGVHFAFYFFGAICLLSAAYALMVVPETKKRSLDEIKRKLLTKKERMKEAETAKAIEASA